MSRVRQRPGRSEQSKMLIFDSRNRLVWFSCKESTSLSAPAARALPHPAHQTKKPRRIRQGFRCFAAPSPQTVVTGSTVQPPAVSASVATTPRHHRTRRLCRLEAVCQVRGQIHILQIRRYYRCLSKPRFLLVKLEMSRFDTSNRNLLKCDLGPNHRFQTKYHWKLQANNPSLELKLPDC